MLHEMQVRAVVFAPLTAGESAPTLYLEGGTQTLSAGLYTFDEIVLNGSDILPQLGIHAET